MSGYEVLTQKALVDVHGRAMHAWLCPGLHAFYHDRAVVCAGAMEQQMSAQLYSIVLDSIDLAAAEGPARLRGQAAEQSQ